MGMPPPSRPNGVDASPHGGDLPGAPPGASNAPRSHHGYDAGHRPVHGPADMSASCWGVGGVVRHRAPDRDTSLDVTRPSAVPPPLADGTAVAHTVPMSATRYRDGCLSVFLLAGLLALAPRSDAAWAAVAGSHAGGHVGGFRGGGRLGMDVPRGGEFGGGFVGRRSGDQRLPARRRGAGRTAAGRNRQHRGRSDGGRDRPTPG